MAELQLAHGAVPCPCGWELAGERRNGPMVAPVFCVRRVMSEGRMVKESRVGKEKGSN